MDGWMDGMMAGWTDYMQVRLDGLYDGSPAVAEALLDLRVAQVDLAQGGFG